MSGPERALLLFESDYFVFAVRADDGTERVYEIRVVRGGTVSISQVSITQPAPPRVEQHR